MTNYSFRPFLPTSVDQQRLLQLEEGAKGAGKGKHAADASTHVRNIAWIIENPRHFVDSHHSKPVDGKFWALDIGLVLVVLCTAETWPADTPVREKIYGPVENQVQDLRP